MKQWGGRFEKAASAAAEAFGASLLFDVRLYGEDILGSVAHCRMLARQGILAPEPARRIVAALGEVHAELAAGNVPLDLALEDVHTLVEARLAVRLGEDAGRLHTARSRNDQVALDLRLFARAVIVEQVAALAGLQRALLERAEAYPDVLMPGYTHLQRAQPVLLAHHLLAYVEMADRDAGRLRDAYRRANELPLGAGALAGVPYPTDRHYVAALLGFERVSANSLDSVADRDFAVEIVAALALVQAHLSQLGEQWVLWSTAEFGFAEIDEAYATGSSIMPQKRNPDTAELIRGKAGRVYGHLVGLLTVLKGLPLAYNKDLQEDKEALFDAVDTAFACTRIAGEMVAATGFRTERLRAAAGADFSTATDLADHLAQRGVPFREAHRVVGALVRACLESGRDLPDLGLDELRRYSPAFTAEAVGITAERVVAARGSHGGTAPARVREALADATRRAAANEAWVAERRAAHPTLEALLAREWDQPVAAAPDAGR
jgi:argininosuccinate lyase